MKKLLLIITPLFIFLSSNSQCDHTFRMYDSWGDGWNGASVDIVVGANTFVGATISTGATGDQIFSASTGDVISLSNWVSGSFNSEVSWEILDYFGNVISSGVWGDVFTSSGNCPSCFQPLSLNTLNISAFQATLNWNPGGNESLWNIEYGSSGFSPGSGTIINSLNSNIYVLNGLNPVSSYDFYVQSDCGNGDLSLWSGPYNFTTMPTCPAPSTLSVTSLTTNFATIAWVQGGSENLWNVEYGISGFTQGSGTNFNGLQTPYYDIPGLDTNSTYDFYVQADCGGGDLSSWLGPYSFTTALGPCSNGNNPNSSHFYPSSVIYPTFGTWDSHGINNAGESLIIFVSEDSCYEFSTCDAYGSGYAYPGFNTQLTLTDTLGNILAYNNPANLCDLRSYIFWEASYTGNVYLHLNDLNCSQTWNSTSMQAEIMMRKIYCSDTCITPIDVSFSNVSENSIDLSWFNSSSIGIWNLEYGLHNFTLGNGITISGIDSSNYTLTGLNSQTAYDFYVQQDCGNGLTNWSGPFSFTTLFNEPKNCSVSSIYFSDDMESNNGWTGNIGSSNGEWDFPTANPGGNTSGTGPSGPASGVTYAEFEASGSSSGSSFSSLVTPMIDLTNSLGYNEYLTFYMHAYGESIGELNVGVGNSSSGPFTNIFSWFGELQKSASDPWQHVFLDISNFNGQQIFVEFSYRDFDSIGFIMGDMAIDLVEVRSCLNVDSCTTFNTINQTACDSFELNPGQVYDSTGVYYNFVTNSLGCDSVEILDLTINNSSSSTLNLTSCSYTSSNGTIYNSSGTFYDTILNSVGCDSVITINLTSLTTASVLSVSDCYSYLSPSGQTYTSSGTYYDTILNSQGCDSIITINFTSLSSSNSITTSACDNYVSPSGQIYSVSGIYSDTISNILGCDSVITINLTINFPSSSNLTTSACGLSYTSPSGQLFYSSGTYFDTISNTVGCDSVITINLNLSGNNCNDLSIKNNNIYLPKYFSKPFVTAQNSSQLDVQPGAWVNNIGANNQSNISLTSKIYFNNNVLYNQTSSAQNINTGDSVFFSFPMFNQINYQKGNYAIEYSINIGSGVVDEDTSNNQLTSNFTFNDSLFSYCRIDSLSHLPIANKYDNFPSINGGYLETCIHLFDSSFNGLRPKGATFSMTSSQDLTGEYVEVFVYEWLDQFTDIYDMANNCNNGWCSYNLLNYGFYDYYSDLQAQNIYVPFDTNYLFALDGNKRYAFCILTYNNNLKIGLDTTINYKQNFDSLYKQPISSVYGAMAQGPYFYNDVQNVPAISINFNCENQIINQTSCNSYSYAGQTYTQSGNYLQINGCDTTFLNLIINNSSTHTITDTVCGNYELNGQTFPANDTLTSYTQIIPNYLGCDSVITIQVLAYQNNFPIAFQANPTAGNTPLTIIFDNQTPNLSNYNFTWSFGDGSIVQNNASFVSHTYQISGTWDVSLIAENIVSGCTDTLFKNGYVFSSGGNPCNHSATINQTGPISACLSDSMFLSCNTSPNFTYQWQLNGFPISGATDSLFYPTQSGIYNVVITENNCPVFSSSIQVSIITITTPTITASGTLIPCSVGSVTLSVPNTYSSYNWSSGGTSSSELVSSSGSYFVTVSNSAGCEATSPAYTINASFATPPDVCIVGVDTLTNYNKVVWEKPISTAIDSFYVYKETNQANIYQKIGGTAYTDTAVFSDVSSNPAIQAYRYKLSLVDSCGVESSLGSMHKSMHLTINQGVGTTWNLIWSHYEGFTFPSYNIYRGTSSTNMTLLTTIASNLNSYTDLSAPAGQLYYQIEVVSNYTCDPLKSTYNTSRSNVVDNAQAPSIIVQNQNSNVKVFPNPTQDQITINIKGYNGVINVELYDLQGRLLETTNTTTVSLSKYERGIYVFKVNYGDITEEVRVVRD